MWLWLRLLEFVIDINETDPPLRFLRDATHTNRMFIDIEKAHIISENNINIKKRDEMRECGFAH